MDHAKWWEILIVGIVGIVMILVIIPAIDYLFPGPFYRTNVTVQPGRPVKEATDDYWKFPIRIINGSQATLKTL